MREVVGREARLPLLAIVDDRRTYLLQPPDRVRGRVVLLSLRPLCVGLNADRRKHPPFSSAGAHASVHEFFGDKRDSCEVRADTCVRVRAGVRR